MSPIALMQKLVLWIWRPAFDCRPKESAGSSRESRRHRAGLHVGARRSSGNVLWP